MNTIHIVLLLTTLFHDTISTILFPAIYQSERRTRRRGEILSSYARCPAQELASGRVLIKFSRAQGHHEEFCHTFHTYDNTCISRVHTPTRPYYARDRMYV